MEQLPRNLEGNARLAGAGGERQQDALVTPDDTFQNGRDRIMLVIARVSFSAAGFKRNGTEPVAPHVRLGEAARPEFVRRRKGRREGLLPARHHVDLVPADPVRGEREARLQTRGIVLGLTNARRVAEARFFGFQRGELLPTISEHIVCRHRIEPPPSPGNPARTDKLPPHPRTRRARPACRVQHRINPLGTGLGFGFFSHAQ